MTGVETPSLQAGFFPNSEDFLTRLLQPGWWRRGALDSVAAPGDSSGRALVPWSAHGACRTGGSEHWGCL